ncbi:LysR family transcriptional regulator [Aeromonas sp. CA23]|uniref:LysR family transcriptional regulator n=1 Tax=Aeromonas sp. CA23 TaxID=2033032 RepID=UPI000BFD4E20|nr:LysR family transcriptional regulator [Aeromonas sp. CA23]ATM01008.1 LysR family transcriptional regulator [Aeromonas sp. CA23]
MFTSKAMRVFITIYQEGSLKKAADKLCLTVPPVSRMLKITEEWVGDKLFIIERNRIVPTQTATSLYRQLLPHYYALSNIFIKKSEAALHIASPQSNSSVLADLLQPVYPLLQTPLVIRNVECIHDNDHIFISFQEVSAPSFFNVEKIDVPLSLICPIEDTKEWKNKSLLIERALTHHPNFENIFSKLRSHGFKGHLHQIDNAICLDSNFNNGYGVMFKFLTKAQGNYHSLPFIYQQPLFIYINTLKKDIEHDALISHIKHVVDSNIQQILM